MTINIEMINMNICYDDVVYIRSEDVWKKAEYFESMMLEFNDCRTYDIVLPDTYGLIENTLFKFVIDYMSGHTTLDDLVKSQLLNYLKKMYQEGSEEVYTCIRKINLLCEFILLKDIEQFITSLLNNDDLIFACSDIYKLSDIYIKYQPKVYIRYIGTLSSWYKTKYWVKYEGNKKPLVNFNIVDQYSLKNLMNLLCRRDNLMIYMICLYDLLALNNSSINNELIKGLYAITRHEFIIKNQDKSICMEDNWIKLDTLVKNRLKL